ncbi:fibronectin type III domain-containing protein [Spirosoma linguale]|uniref:Fibronectin type III domain protein n=1 Tax=Spirosoma linguale (strain ATCC 33905 / DSM 74 / LMG 10896 / Claus 1) TaxID=504472 RepID=D2QLJ3_SPILD|nr:Fibronectin type III domain protein [Spirosoma linguale DSM 74]
MLRSQRLADYFSADKRLLVDLLLKDLTKPAIQVYLRWSFEGVGIRVGSQPGYVPPHFITLQPGILNRQRGSDLQADYFNPAAIQTQGIDPRSAYTIQLPEGFYTLNLEALEASTGQIVSNTSQTFLVLTYPQPPLLNLPLTGSELSPTALQKVPISWSPRHFATPTTNAVYTLKVCEVPEGFEPNEQVMLTCTEPRLEMTIPATTTAPDITQWIKPLEVGHRYAFQVSVTDLSGEMTNFVNQGRSQVSYFRYGKECRPPAFTIQSLGSDRVQLSWERTEGAQGYVVEYKLATAPDWQTLSATGTAQVIGGLKPTADYLFRMRADCGGSAPSAPGEIQPWNIRDEAPDVAPELPLTLTNPIAIRVQNGPDGQAQLPTSLSALYRNYPSPSAPSPGTTSRPAGSNPTPGTQPTTTGAVSTTDTGGTGTGQATSSPTPADAALLTLPYCAMQASSFAGCEVPHPSVALPTGEKELTSLQVGDVLGIYDYAVFVTKVGRDAPLSGEGLARLPFLGGTMVLVEFSGVSARAGEDGTNGGCVYQLAPSGFFRIKRTTQAQVLATQQGLIRQVLVQHSGNPADSTRGGPFVGTLGEALAKYDSVLVSLGSPQQQPLSAATRQSLIQYLAAVAQGSESIRNSFDAVYGGSQERLVVSIRDSLAQLMGQVRASLTAVQSGSSVAGLGLLAARYAALFAQLGQLTSPAMTIPVSPSLSPVVLSSLTDTSVKLSWQGDPSFSRYVVHYQLEGGGELLQTVTGTSIQLLNLKAGSNYNYTIEAYQGAQLATTYQAAFLTLSQTVPVPQHLAYTIQDDHTVTLTWDKNKAIQSYKLVYTDQAGVERTVYPTMNQVQLTGLDPTQQYTYQLVAYSSAHVSSEPVGGRLATAPACNLEIRVYDSKNQVFVPQGETWLLPFGCNGGITTWSNGTVQVKDDGQTVTWADGEIATINYSFIEHWLVVKPKKNTTYTVICQMGAGSNQKNCTYSVNVLVTDPNCTSFQISASKQIFDQGDAIQLTATGCKGQVIWGKGLGTGSSIQFYPRNDIIIYATCLDGPISCQSNTISLTLKACTYSLFVSNSNATSGKQATVSVLGCQGGSVKWSFKGNATSKERTYTDNLTQESRFDYQLYNIQGDIMVTATCTPQGKTACPPITIAVKEPQVACDNNNLLLSSATASGYPGQWFILSQNSNTFILTDETGTKLNAVPTKQLRVPSSNKDNIYKATFANGCTKNIRIPAQLYSISWTPFTIGSTPAGDSYYAEDEFSLINSGKFSLGFQLLDCPGKVVFQSSSQPLTPIEASTVYLTKDHTKNPSPSNIYANQAYLPFPNQSTTYYASCQLTNPDGSTTVYPARNSKTVIVPSDNCMSIDQTEIQVSTGQQVVFTAKGCLGSVVWSSTGLASVTGNTFTATPFVPFGSINPIVNYQATCSQPVCTQTVSVYVDPCRFFIKATSKQVKIGDEVPLTATGCSGGTVEWKTGDVGSQITKKPLEKTLYEAICVVNQVPTCSAQVEVTVDNQSPGPIDCPKLVLTPDKSKYIRCGDGAVTITASGCQAGSQVTWEGKITQDISLPYKTTVQQDRTISAICLTPYKLSSSTQITIHLTEPDLFISPNPTEVYAGVSTVLRASGCYASDCKEGSYTWRNLASNEVHYGSSITITPLAEMNYRVTCSSGTIQEVTVSLKDPDCPNPPQNTIYTSTQAQIGVEKCDGNYEIKWIKSLSAPPYITQVAQNKKRIWVPIPSSNGGLTIYDTYLCYCVVDGVPCIFNRSVSSDLRNDGSSGSGDTSTPSTNPDPCNTFAFTDKGYKGVYFGVN